MQIYWRVIEELKFLGENWIFKDPSLSRAYNIWLKKNADAITLCFTDMATGGSAFIEYKGVRHSLN